MISPAEAIEAVLEHTVPAGPVELPPARAAGLCLAEDFPAPRSYPFFSFSAMDGYAVRSIDLEGASGESPLELTLAGVARAGGEPLAELPAGSTVRIMTGGALPAGCDSVVKREDVTGGERTVTFRAPARPGQFINREGEEIDEGELLCRAGEPLTPESVGLLATFGIERVKVHRSPSVTVLTTGDELLGPGEELSPGRIYDSIGPALGALLGSCGIREVSLRRTGDDPERIIAEVQRALEETDYLVSCGGVSVGDYDFVGGALCGAGVEEVFYKVSQKPGKPLYFGKRESRLVFGLPGNPASALACARLYVLPSLQRSMGRSDPGPHWRNGVLQSEVVNTTGRTVFMRTRASFDELGGWMIEPAGGQSSYMLKSFARANSLTEFPPGADSFRRGERVRFTMLDGGL